MQDLYQYILEAVGNFGHWQARRLAILWIFLVIIMIPETNKKLRKPDKVNEMKLMKPPLMVTVSISSLCVNTLDVKTTNYILITRLG